MSSDQQFQQPRLSLEQVTSNAEIIEEILFKMQDEIEARRYSKLTEGLNPGNYLDMTPIEDQPRLTLEKAMSNVLTTSKSQESPVTVMRRISSRYALLVKAFKDKEFEELARYISLILNDIIKFERLQFVIKNSRQSADEANQLVENLKIRFIAIAKAAIPPALEEVDFFYRDLPVEFQQILNKEIIDNGSAVDVLRELDRLRDSPDPRIFTLSYHLRAIIINRIIQYEISHSKWEDGKIPVITMAIAGRMESQNPNSAEGSFIRLIDNFITDSIILLQEKAGCLATFRAIPDSTPSSFLKKMSSVVPISYFLGRALISRDGTNVDVFKELEILEDEDNNKRGKVAILIKAATGNPNIKVNEVYKGIASSTQRRLISANELTQLINLNVPDQQPVININQLLDEETEVFIRTGINDLGIKFENNQFSRGYLDLVVSDIEGKITGTLRLQSRDKKSMYTLSFEACIDPETGAIGIIELDLFNCEPQQLQTIQAFLNHYIAISIKKRLDSLVEYDNAGTLIPSSQPLTSTAAQRQVKLASYEQRKQTKAKNPNKVDMPAEPTVPTKARTPEREFKKVTLVGLEQMAVDIKAKYADHVAINEEVTEKLKRYVNQQNSSRPVFGKNIASVADKSIDLRQVTILAQNNTLPLRVYFIKGKGSTFKYVGLYQKHSVAEQSLYIKQLVSRLSSTEG